MRTKMKKLGCLVIPLLITILLANSCSFGNETKSVTIASKQFTENILLSEIFAQLIESQTNIEVVRKQSLGTTQVCFTALENGEVDIYVEYTGSIYKEILKHDEDTDVSRFEFYELVREEMNEKKSVTVFEEIGLNNTYALVMPAGKADALGIETMSDLAAKSSDLVFAANDIFYTRANDGYNTMVEKYEMEFKSTAKMETSLLYEAVVVGQVDVMVAYATDSLLKKHDMVILKDDKQMFPDYYAAPIARNETVKDYPELHAVLNCLAGKINDKRMQELNYLIDVEKKQPDEVARIFLTDEGLLK